MSRRRTISPEQLRALRSWKPFTQLCAELGMTRKKGTWARNYAFKTQYREAK